MLRTDRLKLYPCYRRRHCSELYWPVRFQQRWTAKRGGGCGSTTWLPMIGVASRGPREHGLDHRSSYMAAVRSADRVKDELVVVVVVVEAKAEAVRLSRQLHLRSKHSTSA